MTTEALVAERREVDVSAPDVIHGKCLSCWPNKGPVIAICGEFYISEIDYDRPPPANACRACLEPKYCPSCMRRFL